jgi:3-oxo-5-alpha-steroid 4-dehydrogenase 1
MLPLGLWHVSSEAEFHAWLTRVVFVLAAITFLSALKIIAPYGRHVRSGWGPTVQARLGWIVMESPSAIGFLWVYSWGAHKYETTPLLAATLWLVHYCYRAFVYPFLVRSHRDKRMPALPIMLMGVFYNSMNSYVNARHLSEFDDYSADAPFARPSFYLGLLLFAVGFGMNVHSDQILINLRRPGETGYVVPHGGMFRFVSAPNYFGEILEWTGWSLLAWSLPGVSFAVYTAANLVPRALVNHQWYHDKFKDAYPKARRAVIPWLL